MEEKREEKRGIPGVSQEIIDLIEDTFAGVTVIEEIGHGSQGTVFKCSKQIEGSDSYPVAVKVIPFYAPTREQYMQERFRRLREVQTMARLQSEPHIVHISNHVIKDGDFSGRLLILMDYYESSLDKVLDENKPDQYAKVQTGEAVDAAMRVAEELLEALEACAHADTIHYDIKPENIMIHGKHYFLADFGIAKNRNLSVTNQGSGALRYQPPEGPYLESTGDLYSLGLVLYQMVNKGRLPFEPDYPNENSDEAQKAAAIQRSEATASYPAPGNSLKPFSDFVLKLCAPKKGDRFQTATEALAALKKIDLNAKEEPKIERVTGDVIDNPRSSNTGRTGRQAQGPAASQPFGNTASGNTRSSSAPQNGSGQRSNYNFDPMTGRPLNQNEASQQGAPAGQTAQPTESDVAGFFADDANRTYSNRNRYKADEVKEVVKEEGKKKRKKKMSKLAKVLMIIGIIVGGYIVIELAGSAAFFLIDKANSSKNGNSSSATTTIAQGEKEEDKEAGGKTTTTAESQETKPIVRNDTFEDVTILTDGATFKKESNVKDINGNTYLTAYSINSYSSMPLSVDVSEYSTFSAQFCPSIEDQTAEFHQICIYRDYDEVPVTSFLMNNTSDPVDVEVDLNGAASLNIYISEYDPFNGRLSNQRVLLIDPKFTYDSSADQTKITNPYAITKLRVLEDGHGGFCNNAIDINHNRYQTAYELESFNDEKHTIFDVSSLSKFSGSFIPELHEYRSDDTTVLVYFDDHNTPDWQHVIGISNAPIAFDFDVSGVQKVHIVLTGGLEQCALLIVHPEFE